MHYLEPGQKLTIFGANGCIVFSGTLIARRQREVVVSKKLNPIDLRWAPISVPVEKWSAWFKAFPL